MPDPRREQYQLDTQRRDALLQAEIDREPSKDRRRSLAPTAAIDRPQVLPQASLRVPFAIRILKYSEPVPLLLMKPDIAIVSAMAFKAILDKDPEYYITSIDEIDTYIVNKYMELMLENNTKEFYQ